MTTKQISALVMKITVLLAALVMLSSTAFAQDGPATDDTVSYGNVISGRLDDRTPRQVYYFDGARCERINITLQATDGDLDPVLMVLDASGAVIANRDDSGGGFDALEESVRIPRTERYYIVVGRFGYGLGSTSGGYELTLERLGVGSASGCMLRYGDSVQNIITNEQPKYFYGFTANEGDIINVLMQRGSGDLDPYIQVVDSDRFIIADNDDFDDSPDAGITNLLIEEAGNYIIIASRYGQEDGDSTGNFVLRVEEAKNSGLGNSARAAVLITSGDVIEDNITDDLPAKYYLFEARQNDIINIRMDRLSGRLDSYLVLANPDLLELEANDDMEGSQNSRINTYVIPADGTYYIIASRYEGLDAVPTTGRFRLVYENTGNAFDGVPDTITHISYGTTVTGTIDDITPEYRYAFRAEAGDLVTVSMNRADGDLDPQVSILDGEQKRLVTDDDGGIEQNARIERFVAPYTGIYYVQATRYVGIESPSNTHGSFILVLARRFE